MIGTGHVAGKTLIFGPSRAGKSYLTKAFQEMGLNVVDAEHIDGLIGWFDADGKRADHLRASMPPAEWFANYKFLMDKQATKDFLAKHNDIVFLAHTRNIMDCLDLFDHVFYLYVRPDELERRFLVERADHNQHHATPEQIQFMRERHQERFEQAKELGIPMLDATQTPEEILEAMVKKVTKNN